MYSDYGKKFSKIIIKNCQKAIFYLIKASATICRVSVLFFAFELFKTNRVNIVAISKSDAISKGREPSETLTQAKRAK